MSKDEFGLEGLETNCKKIAVGVGLSHTDSCNLIEIRRNDECLQRIW